MKIELLTNVIRKGGLIEKGVYEVEDNIAKELIAAGDDIAREIIKERQPGAEWFGGSGPEGKPGDPDKFDKPARADKPDKPGKDK